MSTLALQNDCQVIASASGSPAHDVSDASSSDDLHLPNVVSHVMLWDVSSCTCRKVLRQSCHQITCLAFSRDDRFLVAMSERHRPPFTQLPVLPQLPLPPLASGDFRDCTLSVWSTDKFEIVCATTTSRPMHALAWDPHCCNEFATCGVDGAVAFWLLDETTPTSATDADNFDASQPNRVKLNVHETQLPAHVIQRKVKVLAWTCILKYYKPFSRYVYVLS